jgi:hypothetical protein
VLRAEHSNEQWPTTGGVTLHFPNITKADLCTADVHSLLPGAPAAVPLRRNQPPPADLHPLIARLSSYAQGEEVNAQGEEVVPLAAFARTAALDAALHKAKQFGTAARISRTRACRLHQNRRCKFGQDCKNVHLCNGAGVSAPVAHAPMPAALFNAPLAAATFKATPPLVAVSTRRQMPCFEPRKSSSSSSNSSFSHMDLILASGERTPSEDCGELSIRSTAPPMMSADLLEASTHGKRAARRQDPLALTDLWSNEFSKLQGGDQSDLFARSSSASLPTPSPTATRAIAHAVSLQHAGG